MTLQLLFRNIFLFASLALIVPQLAQAAESNKPKVAKKMAICAKSDTKLAINNKNARFPKIMDKCASDAWGNAAKTTTCLKKHYPALSDVCANCFGKMADCSASNCKFKCMSDHFSDKCLRCVEKHCRNDLIECTGIKADKLPPKK